MDRGDEPRETAAILKRLAAAWKADTSRRTRLYGFHRAGDEGLRAALAFARVAGPPGLAVTLEMLHAGVRVRRWGGVCPVRRP